MKQEELAETMLTVLETTRKVLNQMFGAGYGDQFVGEFKAKHPEWFSRYVQ